MKNIVRRLIDKTLWSAPKRYILWKLRRWRGGDFPHYLSVALMIKNEAEYIAEWIEYHLLVGVTKFYVYDNESTDHLKDVLAPYIRDGVVTYIYYPGKRKQISMGNDAVRRSLSDTFWLAIIDTDEFIVPLSTSSLPEFLRDFEDVPGLQINWLLYGNNGHIKKTEGLVMERFKARGLQDNSVNRHVKSIHNPRAVYKVLIHDAIYFDGKYSVNTNKIANKQYFLDRSGCFDKVVVNHYYTRSLEEFLLKQKAGRADYSSPRNMDLYNEHNRNDIQDITMDRYIPIIKEKLKERYKS